MKRSIISMGLWGVFLVLAAGCGKNNPPTTAPAPSSPPPLSYSLSNYLGVSNTYPMSQPLGIAVSGGNVWVANKFGGTFQDWATGGALLSTAFSYNGTPFSDPEGVAVGPDGFLYVVDETSERIAEFNPAGGWEQTFGSAAITDVYGGVIAVNSTDAYMVDDSTPGFVYHFTITGSASAKTFTQAASFGKTGSGALGANPGGIALDPAGNVYVANWNTANLMKYSSTGTFLGPITLTNCQPTGLAIDSSGNIYIANQGYDIQVYNPSGGLLAEFGKNQVSFPYGIALDSNLNVYVTDYSNNFVAVFKKN